MNAGWFQVAYERDLHDGINAINTVPPLVAWRSRKGIRLFEATCPHRGANLGYGGVPDRDAIICPFHGRRIGLGPECGERYCVRQYPSFTIGGMVFGCASGEDDRGFRAALQEIDRDHFFIAGFAIDAAVPAELVIENGVDCTHFHSVHGVQNHPEFEVVPSIEGEFAVRGTFHVPASPWQTDAGEAGLVAAPYFARVYSSGIILSHMGGSNPYWVLTTATPTGKRTCTIRLSIAVAARPDGSAPAQDLCAYLLRQSKAGIEKDMVIWEHLDYDAPSRFAPEDEAIIAMRQHFNRVGVLTR